METAQKYHKIRGTDQERRIRYPKQIKKGVVLCDKHQSSRKIICSRTGRADAHDEQDAIRKSKEHFMIITANLSIATTEEATVCVRDFGHVYHRPMIGTLTCRALVRNVMPRRWVFLRMEGRKDNRLRSPKLVTHQFKSKRCAPTVVPNVIAETSPRSDADAASRARYSQTGLERLVGRKTWIIQEVLVRRFPKHLRHRFQRVPRTNLEAKQLLNHFPKDTNCDIRKRIKTHESSMQKES